jgi:hypothetical protein
VDATESIAKLRELIKVAESGELGELGDWLAPRLTRYLENAQTGATLDQALGLTVGPGGMPWWREQALRQRDDAIRKLADRYFGALDLNGQADEILTAIRRYRGSRWSHDRSKDHMPESYAGTRSELLYEALRRGAGNIPESKKHLLRILSVS